MSIGERITQLRKERNMSQGDLADALDVSRQSVSKWENNSATPDLEKLVKMSQLFEVTLDELVNGETTQVPTPTHRKDVTIREVIGALLICTAVGILIIFSINASLGLEGGIYYGLVLASAGAALCWLERSAVQLSFGTVDLLFLLVMIIMQQDFLPALLFSTPFILIYSIWCYLSIRK